MFRATTPMAGIEASFDDFLRGTNGRTMVEADARGRVQRENIVSPAINGTDLHLSIDAELQSELYRVLWRHAQANHFLGGAAVIMDVHTGEVLALTSFPEYDNTAFTEGDSAAVARAYSDERSPVLDRAVSGLFTPGSIVKPMFAAAALKEGVITPEKEIVSTGFISIPNPYEPDKPTIFRDWTVHGPVDMRTAIAVSSDEYFYTIGGGYGTQAGLGIGRIDEYARVFGLAQKTNIALPGEKEGIIPTPEWKVETFGADDPWRIGNTYHTAIGQYGFLITPIQAVRFTAAIANGGQLLTPQLLASSTPQKKSVGISDMHLKVAREGMRMAVTSSRSDATVKSLNIPGVQISAKTGTAQLGNRNQWMNSWSVGFWPSDNPRFAYAVVLEKAPAGTLSGASPGLRPFFEWLLANRPEYVTMRAQE
jgi:penicillin-binding protein 2